MLLSAVLFTIIIIIMISLLSFSMTNIIIPPPPPLTLPPANIAFADHGQEVSITLSSAQFVPLTTTGEGNRIQVFVNYTVNDPSIINQTINSVMKVYQVNGTLIKTSSFPNGFIVNGTGIQRHATTITNNSKLQNVIAVIQFTDLAKIIPISNPVQVKLNLTQVSNAAVVEKEENNIAAFLLR
jgi:hypothetical protein